MLLVNRIGALDPWRVVHQIEQDWSQQLDNWFDGFTPWRPDDDFRMWTGDGQAVVEFDLPGESSDRIEVSVHGDRLLVEVRPADETASEEKVHQRERTSVSRRELKLPFVVDAQQTTAEYTNGVLRITLHQPEAHRPARIPVKS